jgi:hypothetical protein
MRYIPKAAEGSMTRAAQKAGSRLGLGLIFMACGGIMASEPEERQHRGDLSNEERKVEALELIAETLGKIHKELSALREVAQLLGTTYQRPNS